jgi:hypothetical protein
MDRPRLVLHVVAPIVVLLSCVTLLPAQQPQKACSDEKSHQFDFWIGEWEVSAGGELAGHNSIRPILDGCVLQETWSGVKGSAGSSFNFYDPQAKKWRQLWVWRNGTTLELEGDYADGKMVLEGESIDREGKKIQNRITWHENPDGSVRQHWEVRDGKQWTTAFDGTYRKKGGRSR